MCAKFQVQKIHPQNDISNLIVANSEIRNGKIVPSIYKLVDLKHHLVGESFELEIWHTCYQHKYDFMKKISWQKKRFSTFGRVAKLTAVKFSTCL